MRALLTATIFTLLAGCGPRSGPEPVDPGDDPPDVYVPPENMPPWEIVYTRSIATDVGDCKLEYMDREVHVAPQGVNVYVAHYTDPDDPSSEKKLITTIPADEEPARSVIDTVVAKGYWQLDDHATYQLFAEAPEGCSQESATIVITTPSKTGILKFVTGPDHPPAAGAAMELHTLLEQKL